MRYNANAQSECFVLYLFALEINLLESSLFVLQRKKKNNINTIFNRMPMFDSNKRRPYTL